MPVAVPFVFTFSPLSESVHGVDTVRFCGLGEGVGLGETIILHFPDAHVFPVPQSEFEAQLTIFDERVYFDDWPKLSVDVIVTVYAPVPKVGKLTEKEQVVWLHELAEAEPVFPGADQDNEAIDLSSVAEAVSVSGNPTYCVDGVKLVVITGGESVVCWVHVLLPKLSVLVCV